jgi:protein-S-isoprenylcysteine O-methyltransferase Ste14
MADMLAIAALAVWPVIPLFWIPLHAAPGFFRKLGIITYLMPPLTWLPIVYLVYEARGFLIHYRIVMPFVVQIAGALFLFFGLLLHIWTGRLLGIWGLIGLPEISRKIEGELVTRGPYALVRHPTYLAHTSIFLGVFFITGVIVVGFLTLLDFAVVNAAIIPLEERELIARFGSAYEEYMKRVPRLFPMKPRRPIHYP